MPADNHTPASFYDKLISVLHSFYVDLRKNALVFFACIILVPAVFIFQNMKKSNTYRASFTVMYEELVRKVYGDRLNKLNRLLEDNKGKAQAMLGLTTAQINTLKNVEGTNILGEPLSKDLNVDRIPFIVNIYLGDTSHVNEIQEGIINYLENSNDYLISKRKLRMKEIDEEINFIDNQLKMMDSLKRRYQVSASATSTGSAGSSEGSLYSLSYDLYKKKQELLKKKEMPMNLYVIDDAMVPTQSNRSYMLMVGAGIVAGFILYIFMAYIVLPVLRYKKG
jgi:hypothetical protein